VSGGRTAVPCGPGSLAGALCLALLGACSVSPERCDPADESFGHSLLCQGEYATRQQTLQAQVAAAGQRSAALEADREAIEMDRIALAETLTALEARTGAARARVDALRRTGRVSEQRLVTLETRIARVTADIADLDAERQAIEAGEATSEIGARIESLQAEELELETLLQDLES